MGLLKVEVCSGAGTRRRAELEGALMRVAAEAQRSGALAEAAEALYVVSILHHEAGNFPGAEASMVRAVATSRSADARTKVRSLAYAGRCLAQIGGDMAQASAMLSEAEALARAEGVELPEIELAWGGGVVRHFTGEHDAAATLLEHALGLIRRKSDHWAECDCLIRLVMLALETGRFEAGLARCRELAAVAAMMGQGSEGPAAETLDALARLSLAESDAEARLAAAIQNLRSLDAKGLLAYALTFAAEQDLRAGRMEVALERCAEALTAAGAVRRRSLVALAHALTARILVARGQRDEARERLALGSRDADTPLAVSARARAALDQAAQALSTSISTFVPTPAQTATR